VNKKYKKLDNIWVVVAGTGRNVGKTTLMEMLIERMAERYKVVALKTSVLRPDEKMFHGNHRMAEPDEFFLLEETGKNIQKDSGRFLTAGADRSFFLSIGENKVLEALRAFEQFIGKRHIVLAESNVLPFIIDPAILIVVRDEQLKKRSSEVLLNQADYVVNKMDRKAFKIIVEAVLEQIGSLN
jgi:molybdopterin-guanine dinucleotide biosynthesis protein